MARTPMGMRSGTSLNAIQSHVSQSWRQQLRSPEGWTTLPEIPTEGEILSSEADLMDFSSYETMKKTFASELPKNDVMAPYSSVADYVGTHYQLLREDGIAPLREAVLAVKQSPSMVDDANVCIYTHVHIIGYTLSRQGCAFKVQFSHQRARKKIKWRQSKRLNPGTIVALSPAADMFQRVCKIAVVAARPMSGGVEKSPPEIDLFWGNMSDAEIDTSVPYLMVEARSGYFESCRHMLVALQKLMTEKFPLSKPLAQLENFVDAPAYVATNPLVNLNRLVTKKTEHDESHIGEPQDAVRGNPNIDNVDVLGQWPTISGISLDDSQLSALKRILTKKIAVVQGPPGTGKTFVSVTALKIMLDNLGPDSPPIIVAAQTNHALDQLLLLLAPYVEDRFVRIGGRTAKDNETILRRTLFELQKTYYAGPGFGTYKRATQNAFNVQAKQVEKDLSPLLMGKELIDETLLALDIITRDQYDSLRHPEWVLASETTSTDRLLLWLGDAAQPADYCPVANLANTEEVEENDYDYEMLLELEAETSGIKDDEDDSEILRGKLLHFRPQYTGVSNSSVSRKQVQELLEKNDLWDIPVSQRGSVFRYLQTQMKQKLLENFRGHAQDYLNATKNLKIAKWHLDSQMMKQLDIKLIGCTTTGLSKYRGLLAAMSPRTLLIEEAAETLEGTITAGMFETLEQLILIGDHKQLQAHCNISKLGRAPYNLNVSMFERLINNGAEYTMLNRQRRMSPAIREILNIQRFYPNLRDHDCVKDIAYRPPVPGVKSRLLFFHHEWRESRDESTSCFNNDEADMIVSFFDYLVLNKVEASKITILTFYNGQRTTILKKLRDHPNLRNGRSTPNNFKVFTVDSYQGEENDVILLSLVRSNSRRNAGFLENQNRAVVALSRAQNGLYVFGDARTLHGPSTVQLWTAVFDVFRKSGGLVRQLPLYCSKHNATTYLAEPEQWEAFGIKGGCREKCGQTMACGHACLFNCHPFGHDEIICKEICNKRLLPCGHECGLRCGDELCKCIHGCAKSTHKKFIREDHDPAPPTLDDILGEEGQQMGPKKPMTKKEVTKKGDVATSAALIKASKETTQNQSPTRGRLNGAQTVQIERGDAGSPKPAEKAFDVNAGPRTIRDTFRPVRNDGGLRIPDGPTTTRIIHQQPVVGVHQSSTPDPTPSTSSDGIFDENHSRLRVKSLTSSEISARGSVVDARNEVTPIVTGESPIDNASSSRARQITLISDLLISPAPGSAIMEAEDRADPQDPTMTDTEDLTITEMAEDEDLISFD